MDGGGQLIAGCIHRVFGDTLLLIRDAVAVGPEKQHRIGIRHRSVRSAAIVGCVVPQEIMIERCESSCLTMSTSQGLRAVCVQSGCVVSICTTFLCERSGIWQ